MAPLATCTSTKGSTREKAKAAAAPMQLARETGASGGPYILVYLLEHSDDYGKMLQQTDLKK